MEKNGKASCTKQNKHIKIRYFYITDKVKSGDVNIKHCPTKEIIVVLGILDTNISEYQRAYNKSTAEPQAKEAANLNNKQQQDPDK